VLARAGDEHTAETMLTAAISDAETLRLPHQVQRIIRLASEPGVLAGPTVGPQARTTLARLDRQLAGFRCAAAGAEHRHDAALALEVHRSARDGAHLVHVTCVVKPARVVLQPVDPDVVEQAARSAFPRKRREGHYRAKELDDEGGP